LCYPTLPPGQTGSLAQYTRRPLTKSPFFGARTGSRKIPALITLPGCGFNTRTAMLPVAAADMHKGGARRSKKFARKTNRAAIPSALLKRANLTRLQSWH